MKIEEILPTLIMMDAQKMYMVRAMPEPTQEKKTEKVVPGQKLEKTGETERILGYSAEKYISSGNNGSSDLWLAEGLGTFMAYSAGGPAGGRRGGSTASGEEWERALAGRELFPLRVVSHNKEGKEISRMEVTAIEKKSQPDSLFTPPDDYQKMDMGAMMRGMIPGGLPGGMKLPGSR